MNKHTPGPWIFIHGTVYCAEIKGAPGYERCETKHQVCKPPECIKTKKPTAAAINWDANARLIAAAPDLLEALDALEQSAPSACCESFNHTRGELHEADELCPPLARYEAASLSARAAIAKARGES
jgi:hypothetical protein